MLPSKSTFLVTCKPEMTFYQDLVNQAHALVQLRLHAILNAPEPTPPRTIRGSWGAYNKKLIAQEESKKRARDT